MLKHKIKIKKFIKVNPTKKRQIKRPKTTQIILKIHKKLYRRQIKKIKPNCN